MCKCKDISGTKLVNHGDEFNILQLLIVNITPKQI